MEIHNLSLTLTNADLSDFVTKYMASLESVESLSLEIISGGIVLRGYYRTMLRIRFETNWALSANDGKLHARLQKINAMGLPISVFRGLFLKLIKQVAHSFSWVEQHPDALLINPETLAATEGFQLRCQLSDISCLPGQLQLLVGR